MVVSSLPEPGPMKGACCKSLFQSSGMKSGGMECAIHIRHMLRSCFRLMDNLLMAGRVVVAAYCVIVGTTNCTSTSKYHKFYAGINEDNSTYHLKPGEVLGLPELALTYSQIKD